MKQYIFVAGLVTSLAASSAFAEGTAIALRASSLGAGVELTQSIAKSLNVRVGVNYFDYDFDASKDDIDYGFELGLLSGTAMLDWHAFNNGFRISAGGMYNGNKLDGVADPSNTYEIGNQTFTSAETGALTGEVDFREFAPYLGIGWGNAVAEGSPWTFQVDAGVAFQGRPRATLSSTGGTLSDDPTLQAELRNEEENLEDDTRAFRYYPVISFGIAYRF